MAIEYADTRLLMRSLAAWQDGATVRSAARAVRLFAWRHRARRALVAWRAYLRELVMLPWVAHYTRVRRAAMRGWWQCVWLRQHARPIAHRNVRMLRLAFEELRQHLYASHDLHCSPWRYNVTTLHFQRWARAAVASRELLEAVVQSGELRRLRACVERWRIGTLARVWSRPRGEGEEGEEASSSSNTAHNHSIDVRGVPSPTERCGGRHGRDVDDWMSWMRETEGGSGGGGGGGGCIRDGCNGLPEGTEPPGGCRMPLRHGSVGWRSASSSHAHARSGGGSSSRARSCSPCAERRPALDPLPLPPPEVVEDKLYSGGGGGGRIGIGRSQKGYHDGSNSSRGGGTNNEAAGGLGWVEPGPYALALPRQPPRLRVWNSQWASARVGQVRAKKTAPLVWPLCLRACNNVLAIK